MGNSGQFYNSWRGLQTELLGEWWKEIWRKRAQKLEKMNTMLCSKPNELGNLWCMFTYGGPNTWWSWVFISAPPPLWVSRLVLLSGSIKWEYIYLSCWVVVKKGEDDELKYSTVRLAQVLSVQSSHCEFLFPFKKRKNVFSLVWGQAGTGSINK